MPQRGQKWYKYFDTIPHGELIQCVARRIVDRTILSLIKMWLKAPVEERDRDGTRRMTGGKASQHGTPQGGVISPLLANLYINRFLKFWRMQEKTRAYRAHIVSYADDFVILSRGHAAEALAWTKAVMTKLGLTINEAKTSVRNARKERFDFLCQRRSKITSASRSDNASVLNARRPPRAGIGAKIAVDLRTRFVIPACYEKRITARSRLALCR